MGKKKGNAKAKEKKRQLKAMKKRKKDNRRHRVRSSTVLGENAVQHQMISTFGNVQNFIKTVQNLADMFKTDDDLKNIRLDHEKVYEKIDLVKMREPLANMYADDSLVAYDEQYEEVWKETRKEILEELITEELAEKVRKLFEKLIRTKKGHKKEYRAAMAGKLLVESHLYSLTEAPVHENSLWEILFNAALKENKKELPEPPPEPEEKEGMETEEKSTESQEKDAEESKEKSPEEPEK